MAAPAHAVGQDFAKFQKPAHQIRIASEPVDAAVAASALTPIMYKQPAVMVVMNAVEKVFVKS